MSMSMGRFLVWSGVILVVIGSMVVWGPKLPWVGRLPGDIMIRRENFSFYVPLTTCLILSAVVSLVMWLINLFRR